MQRNLVQAQNVVRPSLMKILCKIWILLRRFADNFTNGHWFGVEHLICGKAPTKITQKSTQKQKHAALIYFNELASRPPTCYSNRSTSALSWAFPCTSPGPLSPWWKPCGPCSAAPCSPAPSFLGCWPPATPPWPQPGGAMRLGRAMQANNLNWKCFAFHGRSPPRALWSQCCRWRLPWRRRRRCWTPSLLWPPFRTQLTWLSACEDTAGHALTGDRMCSAWGHGKSTLLL